MWLWMALGSACLLGVYDVAKKHSLRRNGVLWVLFAATFLSAVFLSPWLSAGPLQNHLKIVLKAIIVSSSWISGLAALRYLPLTTASTIKASRPVLVVMFSIILFGERLTAWQWSGVVLVIGALFLLSRSSKDEGIAFSGNKGILLMLISVITGSGSALYDKFLIQEGMPTEFLQSWANVYITLVLGLIIAVRWIASPNNCEKFKWDWTILLIAVLICVSDRLYFLSIHEEDSLLAVISLIRRCSVIITFSLGAALFKEHNIKSKAVSLGILLIGVTLLLGSSL